MPPYEPSHLNDVYQERLAQADAERLAKRFGCKPEEPTRRTHESRGVNALLAWSEGLAIIRRVA